MDTHTINCYAENVNTQKVVTKEGDYTMQRAPKSAVKSFAAQLVEDYMVLTNEGYKVIYEKIPQDEKFKFIALLVRYLDEAPIVALSHSVCATFLEQAILRFLNKPNNNHRDDVMSLVKSGLIIYYKEIMQCFIDEALREREETKLWDEGFRPVNFDNNGSLAWTKQGGF